MLGRGLESLIPPQHQQPIQQVHGKPDEPASAHSSAVDSAGAEHSIGPVFHIEVEKIKPNPYQPRKVFEETALRELAASIIEFGVLQPLVVSKIEHATESGTEVEYQLIAGERRLLASKMAGLPSVPVIIRRVPEEREKLELAVVENLQRANLNAIETARAYAKLQDQFGLTQREVAARLGKSREVVANTVRLLDLPSHIQEALAEGHVSESQGRLLLAVAEPAAQQALFDDIIRNNLSVRELKQRIGGMGGKSRIAHRESFGAEDPEMREVQAKLEQFFGTKVRLMRKGASGKIEIEFYSPDDLRGIVQKLATFEVPSATTMPADAPQDDFSV
ncbi:MAG: ParB/RepB/Spo0J family partition protein [Candidatus Harrisonbacteria bacterium]|nr:ParB/RepB/Spo0J family partition protein [Candidatus Harrisonbacteria bacterium]